MTNPKATTTNKNHNQITVANVATSYARAAVADARKAIEGGFASESGNARAIMLATAAANAPDNKKGGARAVTKATIAAGFKALGYAIGKSEMPSGIADKVAKGETGLKNNDVARVRAWVYAIGDPDAATLLCEQSLPAIEMIGKALVAQEVAYLGREKGDDTVKAPNVADAIDAVRESIKKSLANAKKREAKDDAPGTEADARLSQNEYRAAKSIGGVTGYKNADPAKPKSYSDDDKADGKGKGAPTPPPAPNAATTPPPAPNATPPATGQEKPRGNLSVEQARLSDLASALVASMDGPVVKTAKGLTVPVAGAKAERLAKRLNDAFNALKDSQAA